MLIVVVVSLILVLVVGLHWYLWARLVRDTTAAGGWARRAGTAAVVLMPLLTVAGVAAGRAGAPMAVTRALEWPGYLWMAVALYLFLALLASELVRPWLMRRGRRTSGEAPAEPAPAEPAVEGAAREEAAPEVSRRLVVARGIALTAGVVAAGTVGYGAYQAWRPPRVLRVTVPLAKLPRAGHGFRIAVVSDIHLSSLAGREHCKRIVDVVNSTQADLIAIVGDLVDGDVPDLASAAAPLAGLRARQGKYFVTGNHEYFSGARQWIDHVRELGITPLVNERVALGAFDLAGVNDLRGEASGEGPDFGRALGGRDAGRAVVLMAHQPVVVHDAVEHGVDLQLSGHTHGGQLWPGPYVAELANPTVAGLERYGDTQLYVTRGAGAWGPPVRVGAPSDVTVIELASLQA
ncbi:metallophosphoesterase [Actinocorallia longicatena]|uniref:Metallophosphoesterase n=1 Tax=Actinocorallia longicatena TaxID=111803 RepID=A0ABP6Q6R2_9ACTN